MTLEVAIHALADSIGKLAAAMTVQSTSAGDAAEKLVAAFIAPIPPAVRTDADAPTDRAVMRATADELAARVAAGGQLTAAEAPAALDGQHAEPAPAVAVPAPQKRRARAPAEPVVALPMPAGASPAPDPAMAAPAAPAPVVTQPAPAITYEMLKEKVLDISALHGRARVVELLRPFGVERAQLLREEQWPAVYAAAVAVLKATREATTEATA